MRSSQLVSSRIQNKAASSQPANENVLTVIASIRPASENEISPVQQARKRGRPTKSSTQPSTSSSPTITQPIIHRYNLRSRPTQ